MTNEIKAGIEWIPPDLQQAVEHPRSKRARNSGHTIILDEKGSLVGGYEGSVLGVTRAAQSYLRGCPTAFAKVFETTTENPSPFPLSEREPEPEIKIRGYCHVRLLLVTNPKS